MLKKNCLLFKGICYRLGRITVSEVLHNMTVCSSKVVNSDAVYGCACERHQENLAERICHRAGRSAMTYTVTLPHRARAGLVSPPVGSTIQLA